jgi:hypothetical protein
MRSSGAELATCAVRLGGGLILHSRQCLWDVAGLTSRSDWPWACLPGRTKDRIACQRLQGGVYTKLSKDAMIYRSVSGEAAQLVFAHALG